MGSLSTFWGNTRVLVRGTNNNPIQTDKMTAYNDYYQFNGQHWNTRDTLAYWYTLIENADPWTQHLHQSFTAPVTVEAGLAKISSAFTVAEATIDVTPTDHPWKPYYGYPGLFKLGWWAPIFPDGTGRKEWLMFPHQNWTARDKWAQGFYIFLEDYVTASIRIAAASLAPVATPV